MRELPVTIILPSRRGDLVRYRLTEELRIAGETVPAGFTFDGASVPRWLWSLYPPVDADLPATALHDWKIVCGHGWKASNAAYVRAMEELGYPPVHRNVKRLATSIWGWLRVKFGGEPA